MNKHVKLNRNLCVAVSGGVDSMVALDFLSKNHNCVVAFVDHNTETSKLAKEFILDTLTNNIIIIYTITETKNKEYSWEEFWRIERYKFFHTLDKQVVTAHHLDDCVETYLFNCINGKHHTIAHNNKNVVRPFLLNSKKKFLAYADKNELLYIHDETNDDLNFSRNRIRHNIVPEVLKINKGLHKTVKKMLL